MLNQVVQSVIKQYPTIFSSNILDRKSEILPSLLSWKIPPSSKSSYESPIKEASSSSATAIAQTPPPRLLQSAQNAGNERKVMKSIGTQVNFQSKSVQHHPEVEVKSSYDIVNTSIDIIPMFQPYEERDSINKIHKDLIVSGVKSTPILQNSILSSSIMPSISIQKPEGVNNMKISPKKSTQKSTLILSPPRVRVIDDDDFNLEAALTIGKAQVIKK